MSVFDFFEMRQKMKHFGFKNRVTSRSDRMLFPILQSMT